MTEKTASVSILHEIMEGLAKHTYLAEFITERDLSYIRKRTSREGLHFLTKTLPLLAKAMEAGLGTGTFLCPESFKKRQGSELPRLLYKAFILLFEKDGSLRIPPPFEGEYVRFHVDVTATACRAIRQLCLLVYKARLGYEPEQISAVSEAFLAAEDDVWEITKLGHSQWLNNEYLVTARTLVHRLLGGVNPFNLKKPKHGSGAAAEKRSPWDRYTVKRFIPKLDAVYPYTEYFCTWPDGLAELSEKLPDMPVDESPSARVCFVNKDSRGPRLISCEPSEFMFIQQGLMDLMYERINQLPLVRSQLDCTDQSRNQRAARVGSLTGTLATIDLQEASDRVSYSLVRFLFPEDWVRAFDACRSEQTILPDGSVTFPDGTVQNLGLEVPLQKFAPMGSACCFPVEAIVFWSLLKAVCGPERRLFDRKAHAPHTSSTCVFGDDLVCPSQYADKVIGVLELAGLKVNKSKSFVSGPFRESCGEDYFRGTTVRVVKLNNFPHLQRDGRLTNAALFRLLDFFKEVQLEYTGVLDIIYYQLLDRYARFPIPIYEDWIPGAACFGSSQLEPTLDVQPFTPHRRDPDYGRSVRARLLTERGVSQTIKLHDWSHVQRALLTQSEAVAVVGLKGQVRYKRQWVMLNCVQHGEVGMGEILFRG